VFATRGVEAECSASTGNDKNHHSSVKQTEDPGSNPAGVLALQGKHGIGVACVLKTIFGPTPLFLFYNNNEY
jgi:hypothetical protein